MPAAPANAITTIAEPTKPALSLLRSVAEWTPDSPPPALTTADLVAMEAACRPADPVAAGRELAKTLAVFPPPTGSAEAHAEACIEAIEDAPLDIVRSAMKRVRMECKFTPRPAEIRERVEAELGARKRALSKAKVALTMAARNARPSGWTPPSEADRKAVSEMVASVSDGLRMTVGRAA